MEITFGEGKVVTAHYHGHIIKTDQPSDNGGGSSAPSPFDLYLASIATCAGIYIKSYCDNRNIPTNNIKVFQKVEYSKDTHLPTEITLEIKFPEDFSEKLKNSLIHVAGLCTVKKSIVDPPEFKIITT